MNKMFYYENILLLSTLQFEGHFREYFVEHSKKVVALYLMPRLGDVRNFVEVYEEGKLIKKINLPSSKNVLLSYFFSYYSYLWILFNFFQKNEKIYFLNFIPHFFFLNSIIKRFREVEYIYWIGDFWPMETLAIKIFRFLMFYYHDRSKYVAYLSNRINKVMNRGIIIDTFYKKTIMWGIRPKDTTWRRKKGKITVLFSGVLARTQGIEFLLGVLKEDKNIYLKIIGSGKKQLTENLKKLIKLYNIENQVFFPNKFYYGIELERQIRESSIGIALYEVDKNLVTYFADPAKIKQYLEYGLPVIMTAAAEIAEYIRQYKAGIIVEHNKKSVLSAIKRIEKRYDVYKKGVKKINSLFYYETYYRKKFKFLENEKNK